LTYDAPATGALSYSPQGFHRSGRISSGRFFEIKPSRIYIEMKSVFIKRETLAQRQEALISSFRIILKRDLK
jgi:hypothetical protein